MASQVLFDTGAAWALATAGVLLAMACLAATAAAWRMIGVSRDMVLAMGRSQLSAATAPARTEVEAESRPAAEVPSVAGTLAGAPAEAPAEAREEAPPEAEKEPPSPPTPIPPPTPPVPVAAPRPKPTPEEEFRRLLRALEDPDPMVRVEAVAALRGRSQADDAILRALDDESPLVRREAVRSVRHATPVRARQALIGVVADDPSVEVREEAVAALGSLLQEQISGS